MLLRHIESVVQDLLRCCLYSDQSFGKADQTHQVVDIGHFSAELVIDGFQVGYSLK